MEIFIGGISKLNQTNTPSMANPIKTFRQTSMREVRLNNPMSNVVLNIWQSHYLPYVLIMSLKTTGFHMHKRLNIHCFMKLNIFTTPLFWEKILNFTRICCLVWANRSSYNHSHLQHVLSASKAPFAEAPCSWCSLSQLYQTPGHTLHML